MMNGKIMASPAPVVLRCGSAAPGGVPPVRAPGARLPAAGAAVACGIARYRLFAMAETTEVGAHCVCSPLGRVNFSLITAIVNQQFNMVVLPWVKVSGCV